MTEVLKSVGSHLPITLTSIYEVPVGTTAMMLFLQVTNYDNTNAADITVGWFDSSANETYYITKGLSLPIKTSLGLIDNSKFVLETGDKIMVMASVLNTVDLMMSVIEAS